MKQYRQSQRAGTVLILLLVIAVWAWILFRQQQESRYAQAMAEQEGAGAVQSLQGEEELEQTGTDSFLVEKLGSRYLILPKNGQEAGEAVLTEDSLHHRLEVTLSGLSLSLAEEENPSKKEAGNGEEAGTETGKMEGRGTGESEAEETERREAEKTEAEDWEEQIVRELERAGSLVEGAEAFYDAREGTMSVSITLDHLYVPFLYEDNDRYYIALKRPREVYDRILVIDAGHGGKHPGTMSSDKAYAEKDINLAITLELKKLLDTREELKVYYTRLEDDSVYLRPRVSLANEAEADFFISIHSNAFWDPKAHGSEVLYRAEQAEEVLSDSAGISSKRLAELCLEKVADQLQTAARGIWEDEETYILKESEVPAVLIEVAFLTNEDDLELLCQKEGQALAANGIFEAILKAYGETEPLEEAGK